MSYKKLGRTGLVDVGGTYIPPRQPKSLGDCDGDITSTPKLSPSQPPQPSPAAGADGSVTGRAGDLRSHRLCLDPPDSRGNAPAACAIGLGALAVAKEIGNGVQTPWGPVGSLRSERSASTSGFTRCLGIPARQPPSDTT
ncbi:uncharacterized protein [Asterias amurensis]|uniref:uncharacterized protein n=1 Tax=Asterias amurensis TaxID=7602 RepID=UPI003AB7D9DA